MQGKIKVTLVPGDYKLSLGPGTWGLCPAPQNPQFMKLTVLKIIAKNSYNVGKSLSERATTSFSTTDCIGSLFSLLSGRLQTSLIRFDHLAIQFLAGQEFRFSELSSGQAWVLRYSSSIVLSGRNTT